MLLKLQFLPTAQGGRKSPATTGYSAILSDGDKNHSLRLAFVDQNEVFPGETVMAIPTFLVPGVRFEPGTLITICEGSRVVAAGVFLEEEDDRPFEEKYPEHAKIRHQADSFATELKFARWLRDSGYKLDPEPLVCVYNGLDFRVMLDEEDRMKKEGVRYFAFRFAP